MRLADATVAIVGVGLLGGSLGLALEGRCAHRVGVVGTGDDGAAALRAVDEVRTLEAAVAEADIVVLATPVRSIVELVPRVALLARPGTLVTDVGSTKTQVVAAMSRAARERPDVAFAGGHPMRGGVQSGVEHASADLFEDGVWLLCPIAAAGADGIGRAGEVARAAGAQPMVLPCEEHDEAMALVSHLPHVVASALAERLDARPQARPFAGAGWQRVTAGAAGDEVMWRDILATNAGPIADELDALAAVLTARAAALRG